MKLTFVNVGYGEAILLECPDERFRDGCFVMLMDGGRGDAEEYADRSGGRIPLEEYLLRRGLGHIDVAVVTHFHEDHVSGLLAALKHFPPAFLWQPLPSVFYQTMRPLDPAWGRNQSERMFLKALNDYRELCLLAERSGSIFPMGSMDKGLLADGLSFEILGPDYLISAQLRVLLNRLYSEEDPARFYELLDTLDARLNNCSLITRLDYRGTGILLPGDANRDALALLPPGKLRAHLYKVGHHGQLDGCSAELIEAIAPSGVICCASSDRRFNSAHPELMQLIRESGACLYFSDCPPVEGETVLPHQALVFDIGEDGTYSARYENLPETEDTMNKDYDVLVIGPVSLDHNIDCYGNERRELGGAVVASGFAAARSGNRTALFTKLNPADADVEARFADSGAELFWKESRATCSIRNQYFTPDKEKRACTSMGVCDAFRFDELPDIRPAIYHFAGLVYGDFDGALFEEASRHGKVAVDVQCLLRHVMPDKTMAFFDWADKKKYLPFIDYLKTDAAEAEILTGLTDRAEAARLLYSWGAKEVLITHNTEVLAYDGQTVYTCPIKARNLSGRTGRGDTTFAGYITERQRAGIEEALLYCTALVSLKMETPGPFKGTRQDVLDYIKEFY